MKGSGPTRQVRGRGSEPHEILNFIAFREIWIFRISNRKLMALCCRGKFVNFQNFAVKLPICSDAVRSKDTIIISPMSIINIGDALISIENTKI